MKDLKWYHWLIFAVCIALAFFAGVGWEWYHSPLGVHLCFDSGKELTMAILEKWSYNSFWGFVIGIPSITVIIEFALITIGVWRKKG